jgi:Uma2 family endonuclease
MASPTLDEPFCIPAEARDLEGFRTWARSPRFPRRGRLDYLGGDIEVDMSPEDLYTHGTLKMEVATLLYTLVVKSETGMVFSDRARISSPPADLSVEPDVVAVLWKTLNDGRLREIPSAGERPGRYIELEGAPDLVVEIVSDGSVGKDLKRLPEFYAAAGVPELWIADARGSAIVFEVRTLEAGFYKKVEPDSDGWLLSPLLGLRIRLRRKRVEPDRWVYELETQGN